MIEENKKIKEIFFELADDEENATHMIGTILGAKLNQNKKNAVTRINQLDENYSSWEVQLEQGDKLSEMFDRVPFGIVDKTITGIGATTLEIITPERDSIIVVPTKTLAYNKYIWAEKSLGPNSAMYVGSAHGKFHISITINNIKTYLEIDNGKRKKFIVVADSLYKIIDAVESVYDDYFLMVDEIDTLQSDNTYRPKLEKVIDHYFNFKEENRAVVTATLRDFSNQRFMKESYIKLIWETKPKRNINLIRTNNVDLYVVMKITELLSDRENNEKILIAYNSVDKILNIIELLKKLSPEIIGNYPSETFGILCSIRSSEKARKYYYNVIDENNYLIKKCVFMTCAYFSGIDIYNECHLISVSTNSRHFTLLSPNKLEQIAGRCRNGLLSETIVYDTSPLNDNETYDSYKKFLLEESEILCDILNNLNYASIRNPKLIGLSLLADDIINFIGKDHVAENYPVKLIRKNNDGRIVPSYFNIDALLEKWELHYNYYSNENALSEKLQEEQTIENYSFENIPLHHAQITTMEKIKEEEKENFIQYIEEYREYLLEWSKRRNIRELDFITERMNKRHVEFFNRFARLCAYVDPEFLFDNLMDASLDRRDFTYLNNSIIFWAMDASHPFKAQLLTTFKYLSLTPKNKPYKFSPEEKLSKMQEVFSVHLRGVEVDDSFFKNFFSCCFDWSRSGKNTKIKGLNPLNIPGEPLSLVDSQSSLYDILELPYA